MEKQTAGVTFTPDNARYLKVVSTGFGMSKSALINAIISSYRADHPEMYEKAKARLTEILKEIDGV